jgi:hypothetical protein
LKKYDDAIERNGFATVLYLRLVYFPFTPMNFGMVRGVLVSGTVSRKVCGEPGSIISSTFLFENALIL